MFGEVGIKRIETLCTQTQQQQQLLDQKLNRILNSNRYNANVNVKANANIIPFQITIKDVEGLV